MARITMLEGYGAPRKRRSSGPRKQTAAMKAHQARFKKAAKACKGKGSGYRSCMREQLKKR